MQSGTIAAVIKTMIEIVVLRLWLSAYTKLIVAINNAIPIESAIILENEYSSGCVPKVMQFRHHTKNGAK